ncbi:uncharacterized protein EI97DRAFT_435057 [Westerdykella ornata]|uniref:Trafficking protein particle complex subunit 11 domain-containing protein n=1 Tax=Westerdykella ornata TaxID=318751 RepID=A0A6A6JH19_WESOR|nr:uncharacterized protein EI97DRAFT_435057 [Westerdykella ornata]KAF2274519.1 hypothetical protein EI97DRAFT_435057 [Westerdykella ornata]
MDAYPPDYVAHNLPLIVLSGLETADERNAPPPVQHVLPGRATTTISSELPPVTGERAQQLLQQFLDADGSHAPWNGRNLDRRANLIGFRVRAVGREFKLPPRKADAPSQSSTTPPSSPGLAPSWILHSPISPLSPESSIFPDGVIAPSWVAKHQHYIPSFFISFFTFGSDPTKNTLHDNQLKNEILRIKGQLQKSEYRTRYAVILLSEKTVLEAPDIDERLANIRRATGLDPKSSLFFLPPNISQVELCAFVVSVLSTLQPMCIEYYRELTKHTRRKKARGSAPPPTAPPTRGTSHPLSQAGWAVRYEFKLGVFAEFRQEMDAAQRHYSIALDALFGSDGIFETTASWSPRWDEIRLLADSISIRLIRCHLWNLCPTSAVQSWLRYRNKLRDLIDRRGKGSSNYGWEAWESRWSQIMAQLIHRAELPVFKIKHPVSEADPLVDGTYAIFSPPEKQFLMGERLGPWELLHHAGYWYALSAQHARRRFLLAQDIPEEDRTPPGLSPATRVSNRNQMYDYYLVPEPHLEMPLEGVGGGFEHWKDIVTKLEMAIPEFEARGQSRKLDQLKLEISRTLLQAQRYDDAFKILKPLWKSMSWRREGWWNVASDVLWAIHECAKKVSDQETYVLTEWELHSPVYATRSKYKYDLMKCLDDLPQAKDSDIRPSISFSADELQSCLFIGFTFAEAEGNVGESLRAQIVLTSGARSQSAPVTLSKLGFQFKGCLYEIQISHKAEEHTNATAARLSNITLEETNAAPYKPKWSGYGDLRIAPGQTRVYGFPITFREAGEVEAVTSSFEINADRFDLICTKNVQRSEGEARPIWWLEAGPKLKLRSLNRDSGSVVKVLPKPPKMEIRPDVRPIYYTNEPVTIAIEVLNMEEEETEAVLEVRLLGRAKDTLGFSWVGREASSPTKVAPLPADASTDVDLPGHVIGRLAPGAKITERIQFNAPSEPSDYALEVKVLYHLLSDRDIPVSKTIAVDLIFNSPFEASYDLTARVHPEPWPSYFHVPGTTFDHQEAPPATGIAQRWQLLARIASFADDTLAIKDARVETLEVRGGAICTITKEFDDTDLLMDPRDVKERSFCLDARKLSLEERRPTGLDLNLTLTWQRSGSPGNPIVTCTLPIPRITIPISEPRVLATALRSPSVPNLIHMDYVLENPTMHLLAFELSMEASEEFGFSGPKLRTLHVLPMGRQTVRFNLYPLVTGAWINPQLKVHDRYFNQTLKVVPTEGLRAEKKGVGVWVPADEDDEGSSAVDEASG